MAKISEDGQVPLCNVTSSGGVYVPTCTWAGRDLCDQQDVMEAMPCAPRRRKPCEPFLDMLSPCEEWGRPAGLGLSESRPASTGEPLGLSRAPKLTVMEP